MIPTPTDDGQVRPAPAERSTEGSVTLPAGWSAPTARRWIDAALADASALPPKQPRRRAARRDRS